MGVMVKKIFVENSKFTHVSFYHIVKSLRRTLIFFSIKRELTVELKGGSGNFLKKG